MILASLLSSSKYIIVNKDLIKILGLNEAVILGELCSEYTYWENTNQLMDGEYFYSTRENIEKNTGINAHFQRIAMKNLEQKGIVTLKKMGIPCKIYYKINENSVIEYLKMAKLPVVHEVNNKECILCTTSNSPDEPQDVNNMNTNNNNINNKINNNEEHTHTETSPLENKTEYAKQVTMTESEYQDLVKSYGEQTAKQLIEQLSLYKQAHGKGYESDYAAIKIWVTNRLHEMEKEQANYEKFKNTKNSKNNKLTYEQREYPPDFFDNLYENLK